VFHSWSAQASINPLMIKDALGVYVTDIDGNTYLDFQIPDAIISPKTGVEDAGAPSSRRD